MSDSVYIFLTVFFNLFLRDRGREREIFASRHFQIPMVIYPEYIYSLRSHILFEAIIFFPLKTTTSTKGKCSFLSCSKHYTAELSTACVTIATISNLEYAFYKLLLNWKSTWITLRLFLTEKHESLNDYWE